MMMTNKLITVNVYKSSKSCPTTTGTGISFFEAIEFGELYIYIQEIKANGLFANTSLEPGMRVISVTCSALIQHFTCDEISHKVADSIGVVTIEAGWYDSNSLAIERSIQQTPHLSSTIESTSSSSQQSIEEEHNPQSCTTEDYVEEIGPIPNMTEDKKPPPCIPQGGEWGVLHHTGKRTVITTALSFFFIGIFGCLCIGVPQDRKTVYRLNTYLYDKKGKRLRTPRYSKFCPLKK